MRTPTETRSALNHHNIPCGQVEATKFLGGEPHDLLSNLDQPSGWLHMCRTKVFSLHICPCRRGRLDHLSETHVRDALDRQHLPHQPLTSANRASTRAMAA